VQVRQPATSRPTDEQFWTTDRHGRKKPNPEFLREHFIHEGRLTEAQALAILRQCTDMLTTEPNMLRVKGPVTGMSSSRYLHAPTEIRTFYIVVGDIHGQYVSERSLQIPYAHQTLWRKSRSMIS
jgi:serine/threonine-protein phosphatase 2B catalytic subunit